MDVRALRTFVEVVRLGGFTRAAAALHVTQPAVSRMVQGLEEELGVALLLREGRRVFPTGAGRVVFERAQAVLAAVRGIEEELSDLAGLRRGRLVVGLPPMIGAPFFPRVIAQFHRRYPGVTLVLREEGARRVEELVATRAVDVGVTVLPTDETTFEVLPLVHDVLRAVVHPESPLARRKRLSLRDLSDTPLILYSPEFVLHDRILEACKAAGFTPQVPSESTQWDFIAALVAADLGVALLPQTICRRLEDLVVIPLEPGINWDLGLIWPKGPYVPAAVRAWNEIAARVLKGEGKAR